MKASSLFLLTLLICCQITFAQDSDVVSKICSGKWYLEYLEMDGEKMYLNEEEQKNTWVIFHKDGKQEVMEMGDKYMGEWKYIAESSILQTNDRDGLVDQKILEIKDKVLIVSVMDQGELMIMAMKKIE